MARQDRISELISLLDYAISTGNDDLAQEVRSDIFRETKGTLQMNEGGIANIENMIAPIGYTFGGSVDKLGTGLKKLKLQKLAGGLGLSENALDELDILDSMSVIEIDALFDKMIGGE